MARMTKSRKAEHDLIVQEVKDLAEHIINQQEDHAFGHGFLWGVVDGERMIISYIPGKADHWKIQEGVEASPSVTSTWINLD